MLGLALTVEPEVIAAMTPEEQEEQARRAGAATKGEAT